METIKNERIILTVVIGLLIVATVFSFALTQDKIIKHNGVELREQDYLAIEKKFKDYKTVSVCNLEGKGCIILTNLEG